MSRAWSQAGRSRPLAGRRSSCCSPSGTRCGATGRAGRGGAARPTCPSPSWSCCAATRRRWPARCVVRCRRAPTRTPAAAPRSTPGWSSGSARRGCSTSTSCPGAADDGRRAGRRRWPRCRSAFLASEWADRTPVEVEVPFATRRSGVVLRGRIDAVFADPGGRFDVVDWKTGRRPAGADAAAAAVQLAAYRLAWAELAGVPVDRVRAAFHYVRDGVHRAPGRPARRRRTGGAGHPTCPLADHRPTRPERRANRSVTHLY